FLTLSRNRARKRHGLTVPSLGATVLRIVIPAALIALFIYWMILGGGMPVPLLVVLIVAVLGAFLTQNTTFGRYLYAIGGNPDAARLSGINIRKHILAFFSIMGFLAGIPRL